MAARKAYCGLEVEVTTPDGKSMILAVIDGFDVRSIFYKSSS